MAAIPHSRFLAGTKSSSVLIIYIFLNFSLLDIINIVWCLLVNVIVDPIAVKDIQDLINELTKIGIGVLITDHNVRETLQICHRAYVMKSGSLLASGTSEEIKDDINVKEHYLGEDFNF